MPPEDGAASGPGRSEPARLGQAGARQAGSVSLSAFAARVSVAEQIALTDARVRAHVSYAISGAFVLANVLTLAGVGYIFHEDNANLVAKVIATPERVVTPGVVMAIVGATTVQLGALALTMGRYLYPGVRSDLAAGPGTD